MDQSILYCAFLSSPFQTVRIEVGGILVHIQNSPPIVKKKVVFFIAFVYGMRYLVFMRARMFCYSVLVVFYVVIGMYLPEFHE